MLYILLRIDRRFFFAHTDIVSTPEEQRKENRCNSLSKIGALFDLTENELDHPYAGDYLEDRIRQLATVSLTIQTLKMRQTNNQTVENYHRDYFMRSPHAELSGKPR